MLNWSHKVLLNHYITILYHNFFSSCYILLVYLLRKGLLPRLNYNQLYICTHCLVKSCLILNLTLNANLSEFSWLSRTRKGLMPQLTCIMTYYIKSHSVSIMTYLYSVPLCFLSQFMSFTVHWWIVLTWLHEEGSDAPTHLHCHLSSSNMLFLQIMSITVDFNVISLSTT